MPNSNKFKLAALAAVAAMGTFAVSTGTPAVAHGHKSHAAKSQPNIVEAAMSTGVHDTLVAAVKAADLVETLSSPGPFTVFAPTDKAFGALPDGTVASLLEPAAKDQLTTVLTYHVVAGRVPAAALGQAIRRNNGTYTFDTVSGQQLTASIDGHGAIIVTDAQGRTSKVTQADVKTTNGVIHVTDGVFLPG